jgi:peptidoglycan/LPS O-acetylase OafA/YrhL
MIARSAGPDVPGSHLAALDGLRGLAILMVLFVHFIGDAAPITGVERAIVKLSNYGVWGVDLFFVLSGFLITCILHDAKTSPHYFRNFYVRRTLRIFPLYYGVLLLLFVALPAAPVPYPSGLSEALRHEGWLWTYTSNIYLSLAHSWTLPYVSHFWSLAVEEHFYLVWPIVVLASSRRRLLGICALAAAFSLGLRCILSFAGAGQVALVALTPCRLDALCTGAFLAISVRSLGIARVACVAKRALPALLGLVLVASAWNATLGWLPDLVLPLRGMLVALSFGALLIVSLVTPRTSRTGRLLRSTAMRLLGKYSYGLYVFHGMIAYGLQTHGALDVLSGRLGSHLVAMIVQAVAGAAASLLVAIVSYELFEKHFLLLKDRLAPSGRRVATYT